MTEIVTFKTVMKCEIPAEGVPLQFCVIKIREFVNGHGSFSLCVVKERPCLIINTLMN